MDNIKQIEAINARLEFLHDVLVYDADVNKRFKLTERIVINQERGSLYDYLNYYAGNCNYDDVRKLQVPPQLELKIQNVALEIKKEQINQIQIIEPIILKEE